MTVVVPSRNAENLRHCIAAMQACEPYMRVIVVDDGLTERVSDVEYVEGIRPFVFARNVNLGLRRAIDTGARWLLVLNDDALIETPGGFTRMIQTWPPGCGIGAAACTNVGNRNQHPHGTGGWRREPWMVCFTAVIIPRHVVEAVGYLDERFVAYGWEDNDYCRRVRDAGFTIWIDDRCIVNHHTLQPTFRASPFHGGDIAANADVYRRKWGSLE